MFLLIEMPLGRSFARIEDVVRVNHKSNCLIVYNVGSVIEAITIDKLSQAGYVGKLNQFAASELNRFYIRSLTNGSTKRSE